MRKLQSVREEEEARHWLESWLGVAIVESFYSEKFTAWRLGGVTGSFTSTSITKSGSPSLHCLDWQRAESGAGNISHISMSRRHAYK